MPPVDRPMSSPIIHARPLYRLAIFYLLAHAALTIAKARFVGINWPVLATDLLLSGGFALILRARYRGQREAIRFLALWTPVVFFWAAYGWTRHILGSVFPAGFSLDGYLITWEEWAFGQPALWWARRGSPWLTELLHWGYGSYYFYLPLIGGWLYWKRRDREFLSAAFAVALGYTISYLMFPFFPLHGPRWALVEAGLMSPEEQRMAGYWMTELINWIQWEGPAFRGGAMPSAHTSTGVVFVVWAWRLGGWKTGVPALVTVILMGLGAVYGRYHYVTDVLVGAAVGTVALLGARRWVEERSLRATFARLCRPLLDPSR